MVCSHLRASCKAGLSHSIIFLLPHFQDGLGHSIQPSSAFLNSTETLQSQSYNQNHFSGEKYFQFLFFSLVLIKTFCELLNSEDAGATHHCQVVTVLIYQ
jgi:hypothetical protein